MLEAKGYANPAIFQLQLGAQLQNPRQIARFRLAVSQTAKMRLIKLGYALEEIPPAQKRSSEKMTGETNDKTINRYDRLRGSFERICLASRPSVIREVEQMTGRAITYMVESLKHDELGVYAFIEQTDDEGVTRVVLPPKVVNALNRQQIGLTAKARSVAAKRRAAADRAAGIVPGFLRAAK